MQGSKILEFSRVLAELNPVYWTFQCIERILKFELRLCDSSSEHIHGRRPALPGHDRLSPLSRFTNNQSDNLFNNVKLGWIKSDFKGMNEHECFKLILWFLFSFEFSVKLCGCSWWQIVVLCLLSKWLVIIDELEELCSLRLVRCSTWAEEQSTHSTTLSLYFSFCQKS